ncbi:MAG: alpha/beta hydrolase [Chitinophagaceae bacterium]|nr:MAG: alpha/beta hydrolase [Chitinophagaceae bacterium]
MIRLIIFGLLFLGSLLTIFRAPTNLLWYVSILMTEFCWVFIGMIAVLIFWRNGAPSFQLWGTILGLLALVLFFVPIVQAYSLSKKLQKDFAKAFPLIKNENNAVPFRPIQMISGIGSAKIDYKTVLYDKTDGLYLDFYPSTKKGSKPCIVVIHGGSWAAGDSKQLPELSSALAKDGYHVANINYRLAPRQHYPAPIEDVQQAIYFLKNASSELQIDSSQFILLGRSAGGQIALSAAYTLPEKSIKGVVCFYGPTDMVWGYENPTSPLVLDSRKVMQDYLGGTLGEARDQYINSSATETVTAHTPPTLLIYGENDPLVSPRHGNRLSVKLREKSIPFFELYLPWATHAFDYTLNGPGGQLSTWTVRKFLKAVLQQSNTTISSNHINHQQQQQLVRTPAKPYRFSFAQPLQPPHEPCVIDDVSSRIVIYLCVFVFLTIKIFARSVDARDFVHEHPLTAIFFHI